jgi:septum formation protein
MWAMTIPNLHLASSSPRRVAILERMGLAFTSGGVDVDESPLKGEAAETMVLRLAEKKARAADCAADTVVIGADTAVVLDGEVFGKPADRNDALRMLGKLSGRSHEVVTGVSVLVDDVARNEVCVTEVTFREIGPDEALEYWQSGEPRDKAGAYAIQGGAGSFVQAVSGSYSSVVGLPVFEVARLLRLVGVVVPEGLKDEA